MVAVGWASDVRYAAMAFAVACALSFTDLEARSVTVFNSASVTAVPFFAVAEPHLTLDSLQSARSPVKI